MGYPNRSGMEVYFETYRKGAPLVLIHGNGGNISYMKPQIEYFAKKYRVVVMLAVYYPQKVQQRNRLMEFQPRMIFTGIPSWATANSTTSAMVYLNDRET